MLVDREVDGRCRAATRKISSRARRPHFCTTIGARRSKLTRKRRRRRQQARIRPLAIRRLRATRERMPPTARDPPPGNLKRHCAAERRRAHRQKKIGRRRRFDAFRATDVLQRASASCRRQRLCWSKQAASSRRPRRSKLRASRGARRQRAAAAGGRFFATKSAKADRRIQTFSLFVFVAD